MIKKFLIIGTLTLMYKTTLGTQNLWPLLISGHCSEVSLSYKDSIGSPKLWSLYAGGPYLEVVLISGLTVCKIIVYAQFLCFNMSSSMIKDQ